MTTLSTESQIRFQTRACAGFPRTKIRHVTSATGQRNDTRLTGLLTLGERGSSYAPISNESQSAFKSIARPLSTSTVGCLAPTARGRGRWVWRVIGGRLTPSTPSKTAVVLRDALASRANSASTGLDKSLEPGGWRDLRSN